MPFLRASPSNMLAFVTFPPYHSVQRPSFWITSPAFKMSLSPSGYSSFPPTSFSSILAQLASSHRETLVQGQRTLSQLSPAPIHNVSSRALRGRSTVVGPLDLDLLLHRTEMMANPMRPASNNGELSVFIGLLPSDVTSDEILSLIRPHVPLDIHLRPVGRIVNGQRRSIAGELVFSNPDERQACLAEFGHLVSILGTKNCGCDRMFFKLNPYE